MSSVLDYKLKGKGKRSDLKPISADCLTDYKHNKAKSKNVWNDRWIGWQIDDENKKWGRLPYYMCQEFDFASMVHPTANAQTKRNTVFELYAIIDKDMFEPFDPALFDHSLDYRKSKVHAQRVNHEYWAHVVKDVVVPKKGGGVTTNQMWYSFKDNIVQLRGSRDVFDERVANMLQRPQMLFFRRKK